MTRFPLSHEPFPPVLLSVEEEEALEALADQQLLLAERQLDEHVQQNQSVVDMSRWKSLKTRKSINLFCERSNYRQCHNDGSQSDVNWTLPQLLAVGSLKGTLEDIIYGIQSPTAVHMIAKAATSNDEVVDAQVLNELKGPTIAHPFRFLGLKWLVKAHPAFMSAVVLPRDIVYVEHTGIKIRGDGSKLGYFLIHSVDLPQYPELRKELGLVRAKVSSCVLLRQRENDTNEVDVFMTGRAAAQGRVLDSLALLSTANGLTYFWNADICAKRKKLAWRLRHKRIMSFEDALIPPSLCPLCTKSLRYVFTSPIRCEMCGIQICYRCSRAHKLLFPRDFGSKETQSVVVKLCTPCISQTLKENPIAIIRQEIRAGQYGSLTSPRHGHRHRARAFNVFEPYRHLSTKMDAPASVNLSPDYSKFDYEDSTGPIHEREDEDEADVTVRSQSFEMLYTLLDDLNLTMQREEQWNDYAGFDDETILE
ncbi:putative Zinc finger, FYVE/PHD-type, Zinc finger, RING/FYVE/PHD-type [Plasmopara halstedii]